MKNNKGNIIGIVIGVILLLVAVGLIISPLDGVTTYEASSSKTDSNGNVSSLELNPEQWEQFKTDLYNDKVDITEVKYIDSGENKLVQFRNIIVDQNFPFGVVNPVVGKRGNSPPIIMELICFILSAIAIIVSLGMWKSE